MWIHCTQSKENLWSRKVNDTIPKGKIHRAFSSGKIATEVGTKQLGYYLKRPFLSREKKNRLKEKNQKETARIVFNGLSFLKGTALKAAQMLSFESDAIPQSLRKELEKSYNQVPPINRALVRKIIINNFQKPPEELFESFEGKAFAAASLGQVHRACTDKETALAVKIQYPDISQTIASDIALLKGVLKPFSNADVINTALDEIKTVLLNETDYEKEADNIRFFKTSLGLSSVKIPEIFPEYCSREVLSMSYMEGTALNEWLGSDPDSESKNIVAQTLHDIFIKGFYELGRIHADPNPGNFLVLPDLSIALLDFGCVRRFDDDFIKTYQQLIRISNSRDKEAYLDVLSRIRLIHKGLDEQIKEEMLELFMNMGDWFGCMFKQETFDFGSDPDFMEQGRQIGMKMYQFRKHIKDITPEFIFLDRTRYGLIRLFEKMGVTLRIRNQYEFCD